jgi:hypothetical protein
MPRELRLYDTARTGLHLFYASPIASGLAADTSNPKWIQLCTAGSYVYQDRPVNVGIETFDDMVRNFRAHPAFNALARDIVGKPDADRLAFGVALTSGVIALNFDHPPKGGPRPGHGWFLDVERRGDQLWGLCWFDAEAHAGLISGAWKWTSIEWQGQWSDNKGQPIGAYLSGVALTNDPFITGMVPIQMSARAANDRGGVLWFGPAFDILRDLRNIFSLPETADVSAVIGELAKLRVWSMGEAPVPLGVDVGDILQRIRFLLNLPTLSDAASIFGELGTLLGRLADEQEREKPMPDPTAAAKPTELHRRFAARLSALGSLFFGAQATAVREDDEPRLILEAERFFDRAGDVMGQMASLQTSMGAKTPDEMLSKLKELTALSAQAQELQAQINALLPEVEAAQVAEEKAEGELASQDVAAVMSRLSGIGMSEAALASHRGVLMLQRLGGDLETFGRFKRDAAGGPVLDAKGKRVVATPAERQTFRRAATEKFRAEHQIQRAGETNAAPHTVHFANLYAGTGAQYAGTERASQGQGGGWTGFSQNGAQGGQQPGNGAPTGSPGGWTWSRVAGLPPAAEDNAVNRIVDEMIRTEIPKDARPTQAQISSFFARVPGILAGLGEMPPTLFSAFRRAA